MRTYDMKKTSVKQQTLGVEHSSRKIALKSLGPRHDSGVEAKLCLGQFGEMLDGAAKSESPVENGGLSMFIP